MSSTPPEGIPPDATQAEVHVSYAHGLVIITLPSDKTGNRAVLAFDPVQARSLAGAIFDKSFKAQPPGEGALPLLELLRGVSSEDRCKIAGSIFTEVIDQTGSAAAKFFAESANAKPGRNAVVIRINIGTIDEIKAISDQFDREQTSGGNKGHHFKLGTLHTRSRAEPDDAGSPK